MGFTSHSTWEHSSKHVLWTHHFESNSRSTHLGQPHVSPGLCSLPPYRPSHGYWIWLVPTAIRTQGATHIEIWTLLVRLSSLPLSGWGFPSTQEQLFLSAHSRPFPFSWLSFKYTHMFASSHSSVSREHTYVNKGENMPIKSKIY